MNSCHSQNPSPGKAMGIKAMEAFGLSDVCYGLYLSGDDVAMIDIWSHHPQRHPSWGNLLDGQT